VKAKWVVEELPHAPSCHRVIVVRGSGVAELHGRLQKGRKDFVEKACTEGESGR
jgi:hypothetical protein